MEQLMNDLLAQITAKMGNLVAVIAENCGQLNALKDGGAAYGVAFPCVLVNMPETTWSETKCGDQRAKVSVSLQLAFDCNEHPAASVLVAAPSNTAQRLQLWQMLNQAVEGWCFDGCPTAAVRTRSLQYALPGGIKVYEHQYVATVAEVTSE